MSYDCFHTVSYKSGWIHTARDIAHKCEVVLVQFSDLTSKPARSVSAAKNAITRYERKLTTARQPDQNL